MSENFKQYTLSLLTEDSSGVLSQVSRLFASTGYNIKSLAVGTTNDPTLSRMTIEVMAKDEHSIEFLCNRLRKLFPVHSVKRLDSHRSIRRELRLIKVRTKDSVERNEVIQIANIFRASIIDVSEETLTIAAIGEEEKLSAISRLIGKAEILEIASTGIVAVERGELTIHEDTKEKDEFDYGKNVR